MEGGGRLLGDRMERGTETHEAWITGGGVWRTCALQQVLMIDCEAIMELSQLHVMHAQHTN